MAVDSRAKRSAAISICGLVELLPLADSGISANDRAMTVHCYPYFPEFSTAPAQHIRYVPYAETTRVVPR